MQRMRQWQQRSQWYTDRRDVVPNWFQVMSHETLEQKKALEMVPEATES